MPIPEQIEPTDSLGDAHEAMLESMDRKSETDAEKILGDGMTDNEFWPKQRQRSGIRRALAKFVFSATSTGDSKERREIGEQSQSKEGTSIPKQRLQPTMQSNELDIDNKVINKLQEFMTEIGLEDEISKDLTTHEQVDRVRKLIAKNVAIEPRDVRIDRMLRLVLRLLPKGNDLDIERNILIDRLSKKFEQIQKLGKIKT